MNRRLLRETYHVEVDEINFTHGIPAYLKEAVSGDSTSFTRDYTDPYGSHYAAHPRGSAGHGVILRGSPLSTGVVKVVEVEAIGVTVSGPVQMSLGLAGLPEETDRIQLEVVPGAAGIDYAGRARLQAQEGAGGRCRTATLFADGAVKTDLSDLDMGVFVDCDKRLAQAHVSYTWVETGGDGFPAGKVMCPMIKGILLVDRASPVIQVRRLRIAVYL